MINKKRKKERKQKGMNTLLKLLASLHTYLLGTYLNQHFDQMMMEGRLPR